jgi:hypothetical protein
VLGDRGDAASRLLGALSSTDPALSSTDPEGAESPASDAAHAGSENADPAGGHDDMQRYRALVSALLDVRPDYAGGYFDEALDAALAANRVDVHLARTLRWWQRASVRAAEDFVAQIVPTVMAALDDANVIAERDAAANATAWRQAQAIAALSSAVLPGGESTADETSDAGDTVRWRPAVRLVAVADLAAYRVKRPAGEPARRSTRVRSVRMPDFDAPVAEVSIDEIDSMMTFVREEARGHAHPASSA